MQQAKHRTTIALVTSAAARGLDDDLAPLQSALTRRGADAAIVDWDDAAANWSDYDLAVLRSTWDYAARPVEFLAWAERAAAATELCNPLDMVRWNIDKHYLADLEHAHIAVVPSIFIAPDESPGGALDRVRQAYPDADIVVKPAISAGSRDTQRHRADARDAALAHIRRLQAHNRHVLLQPYLPSVDTQGETALIYFNGQFSHAIRKGPLLQRDGAATSDLFAAEQVEQRHPGAAELALAERVISSMPFAATPRYARVDLIHDDDQQPRLLELELVEPSLFLNHADDAVERFVAVLLDACHR